MTAASLSHLPLMAGGALLHSAGRVGIWAISHYFRAPLANTGILALLTLTAMAGSNALYHQTARHPAPLFAPAADEVANVAANPQAAPAKRVVQQAPVEEINTGSVSRQAQVPAEPIGNAEVFALQKKLVELKLFEGTVDGYYGPKTANAIRAFELRMGLKPQGALNREVMEAIMRASSIQPVAEPKPAAVQQQPVQQVAAMPQPLVQPEPVAQKPATRAVQTLRIAQPQPQQQVTANADRVLLGPVESDPVGEVLDAAGDTAAGAFDAVASMVQDIGQQRTVRPTPQANVQVQQQPAQLVAARPAAQVQAAPVQQQVAAAPANGTDPALVEKVQRGLASLGFLAGSIDGVPGEATAKAIRNFEVYYNYDVTGQVTPELVGMLRSAGATI